MPRPTRESLPPITPAMRAKFMQVFRPLPIPEPHEEATQEVAPAVEDAEEVIVTCRFR